MGEPYVDESTLKCLRAAVIRILALARTIARAGGRRLREAEACDDLYRLCVFSGNKIAQLIEQTYLLGNDRFYDVTNGNYAD